MPEFNAAGVAFKHQEVVVGLFLGIAGEVDEVLEVFAGVAPEVAFVFEPEGQFDVEDADVFEGDAQGLGLSGGIEVHDLVVVFAEIVNGFELFPGEFSGFAVEPIDVEPEAVKV